MRLVNLTVLPTGTALAVIAPTALEAVYGPSLVAGAVPFAILAVTIIFSAQSLLLITTLQAIGKTKPILGISLAATILDHQPSAWEHDPSEQPLEPSAEHYSPSE